MARDDGFNPPHPPRHRSDRQAITGRVQRHLDGAYYAVRLRVCQGNEDHESLGRQFQTVPISCGPTVERSGS